MASATVPNGAISVVYITAAGAVAQTASATIDNATAAQMLAFWQTYYAASQGVNSPATAFAAACNEFFNTMRQRKQQADQATVAASASAAVVPPVITPAQ